MCSLGQVRSVTRLLYCYLFHIIRCLVINFLTPIIQKQKKMCLYVLWNWTTLFMTSVQILINIDICNL